MQKEEAILDYLTLSLRLPRELIKEAMDKGCSTVKEIKKYAKI